MPRAASRLALLLSLVALLGCANVSPWDYGAVGVAYFEPAIDGDLDYVESAIGTVGVDLSSVLNVEEREATALLGGELSLAGFTLESRFFDVDYSGIADLSAEISLFGETFAVGTQVDSDVDLTLAVNKIKVGLLGTGRTPGLPYAAIGGIVGVDYFDMEVDVASIAPAGITASEELEGFFPVVGGVLAVGYQFTDTIALFADGEVAGISGHYGDLQGEFLEARARVGLKVAPFLIGAGYQLYSVDFRDDEYTANFETDGVFVFGEIGF